MLVVVFPFGRFFLDSDKKVDRLLFRLQNWFYEIIYCIIYIVYSIYFQTQNTK